MIVLMGMSFAWVAACLSPKVHRRGLHVAFLLPALAVGFWGLVMPIAWLAAARFLRKFVQLNEFEKLFNEAVPLLGVQCLMAVLVGVAAGAVLASGLRGATAAHCPRWPAVGARILYGYRDVWRCRGKHSVDAGDPNR
jgi:ABC-type sugar transport system permease subunit